MRKIICLFLALLLFVPFQETISAQELASLECPNMLIDSIIESANVTIDGEEYTYILSHSDSGNNEIEVLHNASNTSVLVEYDEENSVIYVNDKPSATVSKGGTLYRAGSSPKYEGPLGWTYSGSSSHYIEWEEGTTASVLAAMIALAIGASNPLAFCISATVKTLGTIARTAVGGTVYSDMYMYMSLTVYNYLYIWDFTDSTGEFHGPFETMYAV